MTIEATYSRYCRREKRRLRRRIESLERTEREIKSLFLSSADANETAVETDVDSDADTEEDVSQPEELTVRPARTPMTPASSEQDLKGKATLTAIQSPSRRPSTSHSSTTISRPGFTYGEGSTTGSSTSIDELIPPVERPVSRDRSKYLVWLDLEVGSHGNR